MSLADAKANVMKVLEVALLILAFASRAALADMPTLDTMTDEEMWEASDFVGVISVHEVEHIKLVDGMERNGYIIEGEVESTLKGEAPLRLTIRANFPQAEIPKEIGEMYLVHLKLQENGDYLLFSERGAAALVYRAELSQYKEVFISNQLARGCRSLYAHDGYAWTVALPTSNDHRTCTSLLRGADYAFIKAMYQ